MYWSQVNDVECFTEYYFSRLQSFIYTHEEGGKMQFAIDSACNSRAQSILRDRVTYVLEDKPRE